MSMPKFAAQDANVILSRLDKVAETIQTNYDKWGMDFETAKSLVHELDKTADEIEVAAFGKESFQRRQAEVVRREPDEPYMETFAVNPSPVQIEADEPYMKLYGGPGAGDQSSDVIHGQSSTGRPLTPHKNDTPKPQGM